MLCGPRTAVAGELDLGRVRRAWQTMLGRAATSWVIAIALFLAGLYLVGLPVIFTVFAHESDTGHHYDLRVVLVVAWFLCAVVVGLVAMAGDVAELRRRARETSRRVGNASDLGRFVLSSAVMLVTTQAGIEIPGADERAEVQRRKRIALASLPPDRSPDIIASAAYLTDCESPEAYLARGRDAIIAGVRAQAAAPTPSSLCSTDEQ